MHGIAVDGAVLAQPGVVDKIGDIDDHGVAFPMANGVSVIGRIERWVMSTPVGRDDAKGVLLGRVDCIVEEDDLVGNLDDLRGRTHPRKALWRAFECGILVALMLAEIFYFLDELGLVGRKVRAL